MNDTDNYPALLFLGDKTPIEAESQAYQVTSAYFDGRHVPVIKEFLVIHVNLAQRHFTVRCAKGCEDRIKLLGQCGYNSSWFGSQMAAEIEWKKLVSVQVEKYRDEAAKATASANQLLEIGTRRPTYI